MAERIRLAMLGCGGMSGAHMRGLKILWENDIKIFDIVATCDIVEERAEVEQKRQRNSRALSQMCIQM